jgi:hypothetical protein
MAAPLNLIALPLLAGLAAGGGAVATHIGGSTSAPTEIARPADRPCDAQTWPYLDGKCLTRAPARSVRLVVAPRAEATDAADDATPAAAPSRPSITAPDELRARSGLTSSTAVLYQPRVEPRARVHAKGPERAQRRSARLSQVPSDSRSRSGAMIVVRPLRLDAFR